MRKGTRVFTMFGLGLAVTVGVLILFSLPSANRREVAAMPATGQVRMGIDLSGGMDPQDLVPTTTLYLPLVLLDYCLPPGELFNPDLELDYCLLEGYQSLPGYDDLFVAPYWMPFWKEAPGLVQPGFNRTDRDYRRYSGEVAQNFGHNGWGDFEGGIYQVVEGVEVGETLSFTIYGLGWIRREFEYPMNDHVSDYTAPGGLNMRVGIDPQGGQVYTASSIIWSSFYDPYDVWHHFQVSATAEITRVSVWVHARPATGKGARFKQTFWDLASLEVIESP